MKTTLLLITLLIFTQCYKAGKPVPVTNVRCNSNDFLGVDNFIGWDNNCMQLQSVLHLKNNLTPVFIEGETLRIKLPISRGLDLQNFYENTFIGYTYNCCTPATDTCTIETDSEINKCETDTLLYYKQLPLPGC